MMNEEKSEVKSEEEELKLRVANLEKQVAKLMLKMELLQASKNKNLDINKYLK